MFSVLTQSHVTGSRRLGLAAAGVTAVHGVLILAAVSYAVPLVIAHESIAQRDVHYVAPLRSTAPTTSATLQFRPAETRPLPSPGSLILRGLDVPPTVLVSAPPTATLPGVWDGRPATTTGIGGLAAGAGAPSGESVAVDVAAVDRAPRLIGRPPMPEYPAALRRSGERGRVLLQFVIDTMGRAEMESVVAREATHEAFVEAVRAVLPRYRFSPGEAGGRRVRTLVAMPFEFTLER